MLELLPFDIADDSADKLLIEGAYCDMLHERLSVSGILIDAGHYAHTSHSRDMADTMNYSIRDWETAIKHCCAPSATMAIGTYATILILSNGNKDLFS
jgi:hypothetical protein